MNGSFLPKAFAAVVLVLMFGSVTFGILQFGRLFAPKPIIDAKLTINREKLRTAESAIITVYLENYEDSSHRVRLKFVTHPLVHLYLGNNELSKENENTYSYTLSLAPLQKVEQPFKVAVASLPIGIPEQPFSITMEVHLDDSQESTLTQEVRFTAVK